jgi:hypothetical protein
MSEMGMFQQLNGPLGRQSSGTAQLPGFFSATAKGDNKMDAGFMHCLQWMF